MDSIYTKANIGERSLTDILGQLNELNDELDKNEAEETPDEEIRRNRVKLYNKILTVGLELQPYVYCLSRI